MRYHMQAYKLIDGVYLYRYEKFPNYLISRSGRVIYSESLERFIGQYEDYKGRIKCHIHCKSRFIDDILTEVFG